jgi:hypothetical protein
MTPPPRRSRTVRETVERATRILGISTPPKEKLVDVELPEGEKLLASRGKEPDLAELVLMSEKFKERVPDREFSMAAIQGYLMMHKGRPYDALECAEAWVQEEKAKKGKAGQGHCVIMYDNTIAYSNVL